MENLKERALARWLAGNHEVITAAEARRLGIDGPSLRRLCRSGRLLRRHRGVYVLGPVSRSTPRGWLTDATAALAAGGPSAALACRSAAWVWGWLDQPPWPVELILPFGGTSELARVKVRRSRAPYAPRHREGLRLTDPIRTLIDIAGTSPLLLTSAVDRAVASGLFRFADLHAATRAGGPHRLRGLAVLRAHLEWVGYLGAPAPSVLESLMARIFRDYELPLPRVEVSAGDDGEYRIDLAYPELSLAVEVDGYVWHSRRDQAAHDDARRNRLAELGWTVLVFTWRQVVDDPAGVAAQILRTYHRLAAA